LQDPFKHWCIKGSNRLKIVLRNAANAIGNLKDTPLSNFCNRVCFRKGRTVAVSVTARKLAVIIWNLVVKKYPILRQLNIFYSMKKESSAWQKKSENKSINLD
jgi:hypothetical protein